MKRSLRIGCVLLVGGGLANCGGTAVSETRPEDEPNAQAGHNSAGAGGATLGVVESYAGAVGVGGSIGVVGSVMGTVPSVGVAGAGGGDWGAGAAGWDTVGTAGASGESGSSDAPPAVGVAPQGGSGGWVGIPPPK